MRRIQSCGDGLFSYVSLEDRVPQDHRLRAIRSLVGEVLDQMSGRFERLYSNMGRPSIPPEHLLRATLLQAFYSVRSERMLIEQIDYNLLFRWFVGLPIDAGVWHPTLFTKNRDGLLEADVAYEILARLLGLRRVRRLMSGDHFTVDGTLIDARTSPKSFRANAGRMGHPMPDRACKACLRGGPGAQWRAQLSPRETVQRHPRFDHGPGWIGFTARVVARACSFTSWGTC